jgi:probable F420-dependent oxidoreductase
MPTIDLGAIGAVLSPAEEGFVDTAAELERLGFSTIWLTGGPMADLTQIAEVVRATRSARIASAIISVDRFAAEDVAALYTELEHEQPGRFVVGLGGAHGADPIGTLNAYLDQLDAVPPTARIMAALGPRMLRLARDRAAGAFPVLITPEYTAHAREALGRDATLAVQQLVVLETDPDRARTIGHGSLDFLGRVPAYQASFRRMGFTDDDIVPPGDALLDALVVWGDTDTIAERVSQHQRSGADHIAVSLVAATSGSARDQWRQLAEALIR